MHTLYLVSCVSVKLGHPAPAKDLYCSPWFKAARRYVEERNGNWRILSAKYGCLHPDTVIEPYNETLNTKSYDERVEWGYATAKKIPEADEYVLLAGKRYAEPLEKHLHPLRKPLKGLGIGQQLAWFKWHLTDGS